MTHKRFRGGVAWFMVAIGAIAVTAHDYVAMLWIVILALVVGAFIPLIRDTLP